MLCMLMLFSASEMWATDFTVDVKCEPTGVAKVYAKFENDEAEYTENQLTGTLLNTSENFNLKYDNLQEGYTFLGWSKGAPSTNASDMVSTDQVATVEVLSSEPTVTYYANFASGSNFTVTEDGSISEHGTVTYKVNGTETAPVEGVINVKENDVITLIVTPDEGWSVGSIQGQWYAAIAAARSQRRGAAQGSDVDLLNAIEFTPVAGKDNQWTFTMKRANVEVSSTYKKLLTNTDITIIGIASRTYTGQPIEPDVTVKDGSTVLENATDYTVAYADNVDAGIATVTIKAVATSEKYAGETTTTFTIGQKELEDGFIAAIDDQVYTGKAIKPAMTVKDGTLPLTDGKDYTVEYTENVNAGTATVTLTAVEGGNYSGTAQATFTINKANITPTAPVAVEGLVCTNEPQTLVSAGSADGGEMLYSLDGETWSNALPQGTAAGEYTVYYKVTGDANHNDTEAQTVTVAIGQAEAEERVVIDLPAELPYAGGDEVVPEMTLTDGDYQLLEGVDYIKTIVQNTELGTATVTITFMGNYSGTLVRTFDIVKGEYTVTAPTAIDGLAYTGQEQALVNAGTTNPGEMLYSLDGETFGTSVPTAKNAGQYTVYYKVEASDNYNACGGSLTVSIAQGQGRIEMLDDEVTIPYSAASITVKPIVILGDGALRYTSGNDSVAQAIFYTGELFINSVGQTTVTVIMTGTGNATADTTSFVLTVVPASASLVNITRQSVGYGVPTFKVSSIVETLTEGKDYTLSYRDLQGHAVTEEEMLATPGSYVVVATLKGNYEGTCELEFTLTADPITGIGAVTGDGDGTVRYDMSGRRVTKTYRGMVIENGKKRYVKK